MFTNTQTLKVELQLILWNTECLLNWDWTGEEALTLYSKVENR